MSHDMARLEAWRAGAVKRSGLTSTPCLGSLAASRRRRRRHRRRRRAESPLEPRGRTPSGFARVIYGHVRWFTGCFTTPRTNPGRPPLQGRPRQAAEPPAWRGAGGGQPAKPGRVVQRLSAGRPDGQNGLVQRPPGPVRPPRHSTQHTQHTAHTAHKVESPVLLTFCLSSATV